MKTILTALSTTILLFSCNSPNTGKAIDHDVTHYCISGVYWKQINLWPSTNRATRQAVTSLPRYAKVNTLTPVDDSYYVRNATDKSKIAIA